MDDRAGATTITAAQEIPVSARSGADLIAAISNRVSFLCEDETEDGPRLEIPAKFTDGD